ncbi:Tubulin-specific chaperone E [Amphibalanus amphitrite]|uniref:Tubulin-specific chaperone E n=1 Tax=Amphibalanus amphitrite TaxID=1232801 RepID=A0A6A4VPN7_AMPAM|nr:Tubulin-specific chaperone E [Amphibalanus amphitrite]
MCEPNTAEEWVPTVGDRVCCDGQRATVRFVGSVTGADGLWVGVEWDNPERGKHNGTVKGKEYFMTSHPTGGSMVRPRKLARPVQCAQAVVDRYGAILDTDSTVDRQELDALQQDINARFVQVIGLTKLNKKQSKLDQLKNVYLRDSCVAGDSSQLLGQLCPNIEELDLAENLLSSWAAVAEITRQLPKLRILNISENRLAEPDAALRPAFASLQILMANRQRYTWEEQLDSLDLDSNPIGNWAEVMKLASLPKLRDLGLANTGLRRLEVPEQSDALFPALQAIVLDSNQIDEWSSVSALDRLPALVDVTLRNNPVTAIEKPETTRELIIARVSKLQVLNRTEVTREERRWAELDYLRRFGPAWREAGGRLPAAERGDAWRAFLQTHPRYPAICDAWGAPEDSELKITSDTISANMVSVRLVLLTREGEQLRDLERRLPLTMRLSKLKVLVNKLFRGNIKQLELSYRSPGQDESREIAMDRDRDLRFFGVEEGDLIIARY